MSIDLVSEHGFRVLDDEDDDPVLLRADGSPVDTWREGYPYDDRLPREVYDRDKRLLQIELLNCSTGRSGRDRSWWSCSRAATRPARAARSSGSWST